MNMLTRFCLHSSLLLVAACGGGTSTPSSSGPGPVRKAVDPEVLGSCSEGVNGPGIIGGEKLNDQGRLGRGLVHVFNVKGSSGDKLEGEGCTGSLIGRNIVLTAAHCIEYPGNPIFVTFSSYPSCDEKQGSFQRISVERFIIHPSFRRTADPAVFAKYDLALLQLKELAPEKALPLVPVRSNVQLWPTDTVFIAGYGHTLDYLTDGPLDGRLRFTSTNPLEYLDGSTTKFELDQTRGRGVCAGDSGGPALIMGSAGLEIIGVASTVLSLTEEPSCHYRSAYTNVYTHRDWLGRAFAELATQDTGPNPFQ